MREKGFTIIEVLVASALLVVIGAGLLGLQYIFSRNQVIVWQNYINIEEANRAAMTIAREIRNMNEGQEGSYPLISADDQEIVFYSDIDLNGQTERVRYTLSGNTLTKGVTQANGEPAEYNTINEVETIITEYVRNGSDPVFYYYNSGWPTDTISNPLPFGQRISDTSMIRLSLTINMDEDPDTNYTIDTESVPRILRR